MPGDPLASVVRGSQLPRSAATWNPILAAAREFQQGSRPDRELARLQSSGCVEAVALNDTGAALAAFKPAKVSGAGGYDLTASDRVSFDWTARPALTLDVPTGPTDVVAVTLEPIPDGKFGRVAVAGWCACDVDVSDAGHAYASPGTDTDALVSGDTGSIRIVATDTGSAVRTQAYLGDQLGDGSRECDVGVVFRVQIGTSVTTTTDTTGGKTFLTGVTIKQRFRDVTVSPAGCYTFGEPYCVTADGTCSETADDPTYYCIGGACHLVLDGVTPSGDSVSGPFDTADDCAATCGVPLPPAPSCTDVDPSTLPTDLNVTMSAPAGTCSAPCSTGTFGFGSTISRAGFGVNEWQASSDEPCPGVDATMTLQCADGVYTLGFAGTVADGCEVGLCSLAPVTGTDSPFSLTFEVPACCLCGAAATGTPATVTVVISE